MAANRTLRGEISAKAPYSWQTATMTAPFVSRAINCQGANSEFVKLVGGTVAWNQLCNSSSVTGTSGHKFYLKKSGVESITNTNTFTGLGSGTDMVTDLTAMFGTTIADYAYSLEQQSAGSGIAWLQSYGFFTENYYPYSAPSLESVEATSHVVVGFNQFDVNATIYYAYCQTINGSPLTYAWKQSNDSRSIAIRCFPNTTYCVTLRGESPMLMRVGDIASDELPSTPASGGWAIPLGKAFVNVSSGSNSIIYTTSASAKWLIVQLGMSLVPDRLSDLCINFSNPSLNGTYKPYTKTTTPLANITLRGILMKDADGNLYYDGDTYESDGTVTRKFGERAYQAGDESLTDAITDGTNTVYKLTTPTTESADPYTNPITIDPNGSETFVDAGTRDFAMPVGNETSYAGLYPDLNMSPLGLKAQVTLVDPFA